MAHCGPTYPSQAYCPNYEQSEEIRKGEDYGEDRRGSPERPGQDGTSWETFQAKHDALLADYRKEVTRHDYIKTDV